MSPSVAACAAFDELRALVYDNGVPATLRGHLWALAGCSRAAPGRYAALRAACALADEAAAPAEDASAAASPAAPALEGAQRAAFDEAAAQIDKDMPRTCATQEEHGHDSDESARGLPPLSAAQRAALRRVLRAYAYHTPAAGYTQGLNFIAALLVATPPAGALPDAAEEAAFWTLAAVTDDVLPGYFTRAMVAAQVDQAVLEALAEARLPALTAALTAACVPLGCVATSWLVTGFATAGLPRRSLLRVWDALLLERSRTLLFQVALAVLAPLEERVAEAGGAHPDAGALVGLLQSAGSTPAAEPGPLLAAARGRFGDVTWPALRALYRTHHRGVARALAVAGRLGHSTGGSFDASPAAQDAAAARGAGGRLLLGQGPMPPAFGAWATSVEHWGGPPSQAPAAVPPKEKAADAFRSPFDSPRAVEARRARTAGLAPQQTPKQPSPEDDGGGPVGGFLRGARRLLRLGSGGRPGGEGDDTRETALAAREAAVAAREVACAAREAELAPRVVVMLICCDGG